jgi:hypothetical protein
LTADRAHLTADTVRTFLEHNDELQYILLHADDGSVDTSNDQIAEAAGFETVYRHHGRRLGQIPALHCMWHDAVTRGAEWILHLENDQEFVAPIPERRDADSVRLYGEYKARPGAPRARAGATIWGLNVKAVWRPMDDEWERGTIHWGAQPSITRASLLLDGIRGAQKVHDVAARLRFLDTLRPRKNITWHTDPGHSTPGHYLAKDKK